MSEQLIMNLRIDALASLVPKTVREDCSQAAAALEVCLDYYRVIRAVSARMFAAQEAGGTFAPGATEPTADERKELERVNRAIDKLFGRCGAELYGASCRLPVGHDGVHQL